MTTDRSTAFDFAGSIEAAAEIVTEGTVFFTPEQLAGQYGYEASVEGCDEMPVLDDAIEAHMEFLKEAGAQFDAAAALAHAKVLRAEAQAAEQQDELSSDDADEIERIELRMLVVGIGQALCYSDMEDAKRIQKIMMDWACADQAQRRAISHAYRNEGKSVAGVECS